MLKITNTETVRHCQKMSDFEKPEEQIARKTKKRTKISLHRQAHV